MIKLLPIVFLVACSTPAILKQEPHHDILGQDETYVRMSGTSSSNGWYSCGNGYECREDSLCCDGSRCPAGFCQYDGEWHFAIGKEASEVAQ